MQNGQHEQLRRRGLPLMIAACAAAALLLGGLAVNRWMLQASEAPAPAQAAESAPAPKPSPPVTAPSQASETQPEPVAAPKPEAESASASEPEAASELEPGPELPPQISAIPVHLRIPKLEADADIQGTVEDETETMEIVPSASIISWLEEGPIPGNNGNAILAGHNRWKGTRGQLFYLDTLDIGDEMEIDYEDGSSLTFRLESVFVYLLATADADAIMDLEGEARVTVITCKDPFNPNTGTSDNRIIAVFKEESVFVVPDPPVEPWPPVDPDAGEGEQALPDHSGV